MKEFLVEGILIAVCAFFAVLFVQNVFTPLKENQVLFAETNTQLMSSLQAEVNNGTETDITGSSIISQINRNAGKSNVEIYVDGTQWNNKKYDQCNITVNQNDKYDLETRVSGGVTTYRYTEK